MLYDRYAEKIEKILLPADGFRMYPKVHERKEWENIPGELKRFILAEAEKYLDFEWPVLTAKNYIKTWSGKWKQTRVDNPAWPLMHHQDRALNVLCLAECIEDKGRFIPQIVDGIWSLCERSVWSVPTHNHEQKNYSAPLPDINDPVIDLNSSNKGAILAWAYYLLGEKFEDYSQNVNERIKYEVKKRIMDPYLERDDFWWMAFIRKMNPRMKVLHPINNWNPYCNEHCLTAFLILENDWKRRVEAIKKIMKSLDKYLEFYPKDGGCDEGKNYWGIAPGAFFDCLELLYNATLGEVDLYEDPFVKKMASYAYIVYIGKDRYVNFADSTSKHNVNSEILYNFGKAIKDGRMCSLAEKFAQGPYYKDMLEQPIMLRNIRGLFTFGKIKCDKQENLFIRDTWYDTIQVMIAREKEGTEKGLYLAAKAGFNEESHNHNDVGQFMVYIDAEPIFIDLGVGEYISKTFSTERYQIWTMRSSYHNLPTVNGAEQHVGRFFRAENVSYNSNDNESGLEMNIENAYPVEAGIKHWRRSCRLQRDGDARVIVTDEFELLESSKNVVFNYITPLEPVLKSDGIIVLKNEGKIISYAKYDSEMLDYCLETIEIDDLKLENCWGKRVYKIILSLKSEVLSATVNLIVEKSE